MYKLGINYTTITGLSCEENFRIFKETGFETVFTGFGSKETIEKYALNAQKNNIFYESVHTLHSEINRVR